MIAHPHGHVARSPPIAPALLSSGAMERLSRLTGVLALLIFGGVMICLYGAFQQLIIDFHWIAFLTAVAAAGGMIFIFLKLALIPDRRYTSWVRQRITS